MHIQSKLCWYRDKSSILSIRTSFTRKCSCRWGKLELLNATTMRRCAQCPCGEGALSLPTKSTARTFAAIWHLCNLGCFFVTYDSRGGCHFSGNLPTYPFSVQFSQHISTFLEIISWNFAKFAFSSARTNFNAEFPNTRSKRMIMQ